MNEILIGVGIASILLSLVALACSVMAIAFLVGMKNSTHQVVDLGGSTGDGLKKEFEQFFDETNKTDHI